MEHYGVTAQFGHVGRGKFISKTIPVYAENGREAAKKVRWMPRVKHHRKDAIIEVKKISKEEYYRLKEVIKNDPYFKVSSKQEQDKLCINLEKAIVSYEEHYKIRKKKNGDKIKYKMKKTKSFMQKLYIQ